MVLTDLFCVTGAKSEQARPICHVIPHVLGHHPDSTQANHALTFKLDHLVGADQGRVGELLFRVN